MKMLPANSTVVFGLNYYSPNSNVREVQTTNHFLINENHLSTATLYEYFNMCFPFGEDNEYVIYCRAEDLIHI